jgi:exosortase/archaeosortase family protein
MKIPQTITPLLWRVIVFLGLFVLISGIVGPRVISGGILFRDGFALYGGIGKAFIFGLIAFALLARRVKTPPVIRPWRPELLGWMLAALLAFALATSSISKLLLGERTLINLMLAHGGLIVSLVLTAIGCFGLKNIQTIWRSYRRIITASAIISVLFYVFLLVVYSLWKPLASAVMHSVNWLLGITGLHTTVVPPNTLLLDKFGVTVAEYCSGIESIALFTGLYVIVGLLDWNKLNRRRYIIVFPFALLGLFLFNILRVFGLILAGYHINPQIAFSLFHTYAGMVFFILYSIVFWSIAYKYILDKKPGGTEESHDPA